jgi:peptide/nickel transport system ATP-binding protein
LLKRLGLGIGVPALNVANLTVRYSDGIASRAVLEDVSFSIEAHEIVGVSGPSGSGKTTVALALFGLLPQEANVSGTITFDGRELGALDERARGKIRGAEMGIVFQESAIALNPVLTVGAQIGDVVRAHTRSNRRQTRDLVLTAMRDVGLTDDTARIYDAYPHELSGGQRQRILIAQAIVCRPSLVVADEPTASLDAAVRDEILRLIRRLNEQHGTAFLIISHSAEVLERTASRTLVMDRGRIVRVMGSQNAIGSDGYVARSISRSVSASRHVPIAEVAGATKSYQQRRLLSGSRHTVEAVRGVDLRVERGATLGLAGPSGCGKSTLARCLAGLESLDAGRVTIDGQDITSLRGRALLPYRNQVQLIFQDSAAALNPRFTALDIVTEPLVIQREGTSSTRRLRAIELLSQVGIPADRLQSRPGEFSGGERQRLAIARALAVRPQLLILDEAFSGLDLDTRSLITTLLMTLQREQDLALLCISHDFEFLAEFAPEIALMHRGVIVEQGTTVRRYVPDAVLRPSAEPLAEPIAQTDPEDLQPTSEQAVA